MTRNERHGLERLGLAALLPVVAVARHDFMAMSTIQTVALITEPQIDFAFDEQVKKVFARFLKTAVFLGTVGFDVSRPTVWERNVKSILVRSGFGRRLLSIITEVRIHRTSGG